eukprot:gene5393-2433_t
MLAFADLRWWSRQKLDYQCGRLVTFAHLSELFLIDFDNSWCFLIDSNFIVSFHPLPDYDVFTDQVHKLRDIIPSNITPLAPPSDESVSAWA